MHTVLFIGAGRHQRKAIERTRELGFRVVAVDRNPEAPGLEAADIGEVVDFGSLPAILAAARRIRPDGVLTVAADRAVPVVAAVAEELGLPGIGSEAAHRVTNKVAMRLRLAEAEVPQPRFRPVTSVEGAREAIQDLDLPVVVKPADSSGQRGLTRVTDDARVDAAAADALSASRSGEAIVESFHAGHEVNCLAVARAGEVTVLTLSDRHRPEGNGFGVCLSHLYPAHVANDVRAELERVAAASVQALGLSDSVAYPQLLVSDDGVRVVEVAARIPGGQMGEVARRGIGVDLLEIVLRQALGQPVPDELVSPRFQQPLAIRFLTAEPGPLPTGTVKAIHGLEKLQKATGVVDAASYMAPGEVIRPVTVDGDRRGYVIAVGATREEALERADAAAALIEVEVA